MEFEIKDMRDAVDLILAMTYTEANSSIPDNAPARYVDLLPRFLRKAVHDAKWYAGERGEQISYSEAYKRASRELKDSYPKTGCPKVSAAVRDFVDKMYELDAKVAELAKQLPSSLGSTQK